MLGGTAFLAELARFHIPATVLLVVAALALLWEALRGLTVPDPLALIRVSRDVAFIAALAAAIAFVSTPARWSAGAAIVAFEFGLVLELFGHFVTESPPA